jgi:caa(3)-type oxidase subunit IV
MSEHAEHAHPNYVKVWAILVGLLVVSLLGPEIGIQWITLITAFGIAVVKAYMVAKNFMHLNVEPRFIVYLLVTMLAFMFLFYAGVAPDVMKAEGSRWEKPAWLASAQAQDGHTDHSH